MLREKAHTIKKRIRKIYCKYFTIEDSQHSLLPDSIYLKKQFKEKMGKELDLRHPKTYNEKLQWIKLHDRKPIYTVMVDKFAVKQYVADLIGEGYIIPTLALYKTAEEIDFDELPERFVLKCTHSSGIGSCICTDKSLLDYDKIKNGLKQGLEDNYYLDEREWPYKNVPRQIIAEEYIADSNGKLIDYKFMCFHGEIDSIQVCFDRETGNVKFAFYDLNWNRLHYLRDEPELNEEIPKPDNFEEMVRIARILSKGIRHIRVDLYNLDGKIYFGELTFFDTGGYFKEITDETDLKWGSLISLK